MAMNASKSTLPKDFIERIASQIDDSDSFFQSLNGDSPTFIRLNEQKRAICHDALEGEQVVWNSDGLRLAERPKFNQDPRYHAGLYYPMEGSSMYLKHVLQQIRLDENSMILDLCAAPGGKSLILKDAFPDSYLVSNEIEQKRAHILKENAIRWGTEGHCVIQSDAARLAKSELKFDLILVDAPCSGEGLFRKDEKSREEWTLERAAGCAIRQSQILDDVQNLLKPGGYLIYSTCTYNQHENMDQVQRLVEEFGFHSLAVQNPLEWNIQEEISDSCFGYQFWPHRIEGEGFFIALLQKEGEYFQNDNFRIKSPKSIDLDLPQGIDLGDKEIIDLKGLLFAFSERDWFVYQRLMDFGNLVKKGLFLGELKGKDFIPSHDLSSHQAASTFSNTLELDLEQALYYLKGNALQHQVEKGIVQLRYRGLSIGFGKSNGQRINNLIPKHLRIH